jgi:hypothetical protein
MRYLTRASSSVQRIDEPKNEAPVLGASNRIRRSSCCALDAAIFLTVVPVAQLIAGATASGTESAG